MQFLDLVEANRQREHELKMRRRRTTYFWGAVGFIVGFIGTIIGNGARRNTAVVIED